MEEYHHIWLSEEQTKNGKKVLDIDASKNFFEDTKSLKEELDKIQNFIEEIKKVFDGKDHGDIMLSTVHKAKGLEADNVYILATERMPHPLGNNEENNICYVAITRAKKNLFYCGPRPGIV